MKRNMKSNNNKEKEKINCKKNKFTKDDKEEKEKEYKLQ